jgi:hypothetical protein
MDGSTTRTGEFLQLPQEHRQIIPWIQDFYILKLNDEAEKNNTNYPTAEIGKLKKGDLIYISYEDKKEGTTHCYLAKIDKNPKNKKTTCIHYPKYHFLSDVPVEENDIYEEIPNEEIVFIVQRHDLQNEPNENKHAPKTRQHLITQQLNENLTTQLKTERTEKANLIESTQTIIDSQKNQIEQLKNEIKKIQQQTNKNKKHTISN